MHKSAVLIPALVLAMVSGLPAAAAPDRADVVVVLRSDAPSTVARDHGVQLTHTYDHALNGFAGSVPQARLNGLTRDPRVASVEVDTVVSVTAQQVPTGIVRAGATANAAIAIDGIDQRVDVDVAVLDTGVDANHPDLVVVAQTNCARRGPSNTSCQDGSAADGDGHGTHVSGTIGALDNDLGVVGIAPGARIHAVKVLGDNGSGYLSWIIAGIDWVTARAATIEVANMSLGFQGRSTALDTAISRSVATGITYAVAAGNDAMDASGFAPASNPDVITVSALADFDGLPGGDGSPTCRTDVDDTLADFSNFGPAVEIAAPGVCILSTVPGGGYAAYSGTSMASPHVAGAAALLAAGDAELSPTGIRDALIDAGGADWTDESGDGTTEPLLDVSDAGVFAPTLIAPPTDGGGGGGDTGGGGGGNGGCKPGKGKNAC